MHKVLRFVAITALLAPLCGEAQSLNIGDAAPPLKPAAWIKGQPVETFKKGHVYVIDFWATWCGPCMAAMPLLSQLQKRFKDRLTVIAVDCRESPPSAVKDLPAWLRKFVAQQGEKMALTVAMDDQKTLRTFNDWVVAAGLGKAGIPVTLLVDQDGKIAWIGQPSGDPEEFEQAVTQLVEGKLDRTLARQVHRREMNNAELMNSDAPGSATLHVGDVAPPFAPATWVKGTPVNGLQKGRWYVLGFWGTVYYDAFFMTRLNGLQRQYADRMQVIAVDTDEPADNNITLETIKATVNIEYKDVDHVSFAIDDMQSRPISKAWVRAAGLKLSKGLFAIAVNPQGQVAAIAHLNDLEKMMPKLLDGSLDPQEARRIHLALMNGEHTLSEEEKLDRIRGEVWKTLAVKNDEASKSGNYTELLSTAQRLDSQMQQRFGWDDEIAFQVSASTFVALLQIDEPRAVTYLTKQQAIFESKATPPMNPVIPFLQHCARIIAMKPGRQRATYLAGLQAAQYSLDKALLAGEQPGRILAEMYDRLARAHDRLNNPGAAADAERLAIQAMAQDSWKKTNPRDFKGTMQQYEQSLRAYQEKLPRGSTIEQTKDNRLEPIPLEIAYGRKEVRSIIGSPDGLSAAIEISNGKNLQPMYPQLGQTYTSTGYLGLGYNDPNEIWIFDARTRKLQTISVDGSTDWSPAWSPDGSRLAFYSDRDGMARLWVWDRSTGQARRVSTEIVRPYIRDRPQWLANGGQVFTKLLPEGLSLQDGFDLMRRKAPVTLGKQDALTGEVFDTLKPVADPNGVNFLLVDLAVVDIDSGVVRRVVSRATAKDAAISRDGEWIAYNTWSMPADGARFIGTFQVISARTGHAVYSNPGKATWDSRYAWSADSSLLFFNLNEGNKTGPFDEGLRLFDPKTQRSLLMSTLFAADANIYNAMWDSAGHGLLVSSYTGVWSLDGMDSKPIDVRFPEEIYKIRTLFVGAAGGVNDHAYRPYGSNIYLTSSGYRNKRYSLGIFDVTNGKSKTLFTIPAGDNLWMLVPLLGGSQYLYTRDTQDDHAFDLWSYDLKSATHQRLTTLNAAYGRYSKGKVRQVTWKAQGGIFSASLTLPPDFRPERRYPLLLDVYAMHNEPPKAAEAAGSSSMFDNKTFTQIYTTRGYALLDFSGAAISYETPMRDIAEQAMAGVDEVMKLGFIDETRLAVRGVSFGGYCVRSLITQTDRFKAAISIYGLGGNLFSTYSAMNDTGEPKDAAWLEQGIGNGLMGTSPWKHRQRYIDNSPFFLYDKVKTPLLIEVSMNDPVGSDSYETFVAYKMLGLNAQMVRYYGEQHGFGELRGHLNNIDFASRQLNFLAEHLDLEYDNTGAVIFNGNRAKSRGAQPAAAH